MVGPAPVGGLVLAAGAASRYGPPKVLARLAGRTLLEHALDALVQGGCDPVLAVLGANAEAIRRAVALPTTVFNPDWSTGMGSSLRAGLAALPADLDAVVVALADQPLVGAEVVRRLVRAVAAVPAGAGAAVATYAGRPRNPVLLTRPVFAEVAAAVHGDRGARDWLRAHPDRVVPVPCDDAGDPADVDTPADLARLAGSVSSREELSP
ncbi:MAG TPA: nucleotidyltransferase family protein [Mycobacteriales bacterium]|nr:nucleotidyltransferase family protein [Mycobacteriales bacterium]